MEITSQVIDAVVIVELVGELDAKTAPYAETQILSLAQAGGVTLLSMRDVTYMSSAGLRMLLVLYRRLGGLDGRIALVGLSSRIRETMDATGFLEHFLTFEDLNQAWQELAGRAEETDELVVSTD